MIDVNIRQIGDIVSELNGIIDEYEETQLNIFNQLKDSCNNWHDRNSLEFSDKSKEEKKSSEEFFRAIKNNKKVFEQIYVEYKAIGEKLHFNMEKKDAIIEAIDQCLSITETAINEFNSVERSFYYQALIMINVQRDQLISIKNDLKAMKEKVNNLHRKAMSIEEKILSRINKLEDIKTSRFTFSFK